MAAVQQPSNYHWVTNVRFSWDAHIPYMNIENNLLILNWKKGLCLSFPFPGSMPLRNCCTPEHFCTPYYHLTWVQQTHHKPGNTRCFPIHLSLSEHWTTYFTNSLWESMVSIFSRISTAVLNRAVMRHWPSQGLAQRHTFHHQKNKLRVQYPLRHRAFISGMWPKSTVPTMQLSSMTGHERKHLVWGCQSTLQGDAFDLHFKLSADFLRSIS